MALYAAQWSMLYQVVAVVYLVEQLLVCTYYTASFE
jgi:hypothetical protein